MIFEKKPETLEAIQFTGTEESAAEIDQMLFDLASNRGYLKSFHLSLVTVVKRRVPFEKPYLEVSQPQGDDGTLITKIFPDDWAVVFPNGEFACWLDRDIKRQYYMKEV